MNEIFWNEFNYFGLKNEGYAVFSTASVDLVFTLRGNCMIDVFDLKTFKQIAYLDFDLLKSVILASAFRSPLIGLPFSAQFRKRFETDLLPFKDLRSEHEVGFFIDIEYRNKGNKEIWNLDELMMAIAFETALESNIRDFTIKPTGDTAGYYHKKYNAKTEHPAGSDLIMTVHLKTVRKTMQHIMMIEKEGKTVYFKVKNGPDVKVA
jgi:hypothetical protein